PGRGDRLDAADVRFGAIGWYPASADEWASFASWSAANPYLAGANARLLVPSPDYPLERYGTWYATSPRHRADREIPRCAGDEGGHCWSEPLPGTWYPIDHPIWGDFGITPPIAELPTDHPAWLDPDITVGQPGVLRPDTTDFTQE